MAEIGTNWTAIPKFVVAGVPNHPLRGLRTTGWIDLIPGNEPRLTHRWDFACKSVDCEQMLPILNYANKHFPAHTWKIRVRAGTRRIYE